MTQLTEKAYTGEWLKWLANRDFCLDVLTLKATTSQSIKSGSLLRDNTGYILCENGQETSVTAISLTDVKAVGSEKVLALVRGPAVIDPDKLDAVQIAAGVTWAEAVAALAALDIRPAQAALAEWLTQTY